MVFAANARVNRRKPKTRVVSGRAMAHAVDGKERPYPTYRFSGRVFYERVGHNPFKGL